MIIVKLMGGQGNQMFQYSIARYLSIRYNTDYKFDLNSFKKIRIINHYNLDTLNTKVTEYDNKLIIFCMRLYFFLHFRINIKIIREIIKKIISLLCNMHIITEDENHTFCNEIYNLHKKIKKKNIYLYGYFQNSKYYSEIEDLIREEFKSKNILKGEALNILNKIKSTNSIAIHVRRGDYLKLDFPIITTEYILKAIEIMNTKTQNAHFYVFSDDIEWCRENIKEHSLTIVDLSSEYKNYDFDLMRNCNHFIISSSTYSYWASYLGENENKIIIAPENWCKDIGKDILMKDCIILK